MGGFQILIIVKNHTKHYSQFLDDCGTEYRPGCSADTPPVVALPQHITSKLVTTTDCLIKTTSQRLHIHTIHVRKADWDDVVIWRERMRETGYQQAEIWLL